MIANKKILITGGAGFIGTHLAQKLVYDNELVLFDNYRRDSLTGLDLADREDVTVIKGDVLKPEDLAEAVKGADIVLHLAAIAGVSSYYAIPLTVL